MRADTIKNSLNKARTNNLPAGKPGIVFVKVPQTWLEREPVRIGIYAVVAEFLGNTERIVSVVVYATVATELAEQKMTLMRHTNSSTPYTALIEARTGPCLGITRFRRNGAACTQNGRVYSRKASSCATNSGAHRRCAAGSSVLVPRRTPFAENWAPRITNTTRPIDKSAHALAPIGR